MLQMLMEHLLLSLTNGEHLNVFLISLQPLSSIVSSYRQIPTFGVGTIRKFASNASEMKKLAGRDFEDLLLVGCLDFSLPFFLPI
jgi:hypothetical protein